MKYHSLKSMPLKNEKDLISAEKIFLIVQL